MKLTTIIAPLTQIDADIFLRVYPPSRTSSYLLNGMSESNDYIEMHNRMKAKAQLADPKRNYVSPLNETFVRLRAKFGIMDAIRFGAKEHHMSAWDYAEALSLSDYFIRHSQP